MVKDYKTVYKGGCGELVEKKSRFLASVAHVESEEEAIAFIEAKRKEYWDARHNCYAYVIGTAGELLRSSDDGEPSQTAGKPMLDVLTGRKLCNIVVVVTRYFGGVLLGTGGLVRAYSGAVIEGLNESVIIEKKLADKLQVLTDYSGVGKVLYLMNQNGCSELENEYTDRVRIVMVVPVEETARMEAALTEATNGGAKLSREGQCYFAEIDGVCTLFEH